MTNESDNQKTNRIDWLQHQIDYNGRYHDHKETMAWLATAFYLTGILYLAYRVHSFVLTCVGEVIYSLVFAFAGCLFYSFVKWQFDKRWIAHQRVWFYVKDLDRAIFNNDISLATDGKINKECKDYLTAFKDIFRRFVCKEGRLCQQLEPIVSETITYIGIISVTIMAIVLVSVH